MAEIEHVRAPAQSGRDTPDLTSECIPSRKEAKRIEIALESDVARHARRDTREVGTGVERDAVHPGVCSVGLDHQPGQPRKTDDWRMRETRVQRGNDDTGRLDHGSREQR